MGEGIVLGSLELSLEGEIEAHPWCESRRRMKTYLGKVKLVGMALTPKIWGGKGRR